MVSAYAGEPGLGLEGTEKLGLPLRTNLAGRSVEVDTFVESDWEAGRKLMNDVIADGKTWPFIEEFPDLTSYRGYFLSHAAFVVREVSTGRVLGAFYVKPNFPGRCGHICNGGFIVDPTQRGIKVGTLMGCCFLSFARLLGYRAAYFNLVFASNPVSVKLWENLGFKRVATIPKAARLRGVGEEGFLDTAYGYHFDLDALNGSLHGGVASPMSPSKNEATCPTQNLPAATDIAAAAASETVTAPDPLSQEASEVVGAYDPLVHAAQVISRSSRK